MLEILKKIIPKPVFEFFQPAYHYSLAVLGAVSYGFPGKKMIVIGVTGTKGKTTTVELINSIFEAAHYKTAIISTLRFKKDEKEERNMFKMSMPGRFFIQKFLRGAVEAGCDVAIVETTSEGAKQFRHKFLFLDALVFTNLAPEHLESHGSYRNYLEAKLSIARELENKKDKAIIANTDDPESEKFLNLNIENKIPYSLSQSFNVHADENGSSFQIEKTVIYMKLPGIFNVSNALGAIALARYFEISMEDIKKGLENVNMVRGRMEKVSLGQDFEVVVDYAHTPDSLKAVYETYKDKKIIAVLGNTGGGRDKWKRPEMGRIADEYADEIILTNEDPYDEDPIEIVEQMRAAITKTPVEIILDRREAIASAIARARTGDAVLITGKGTDPYIMGPRHTRTSWDDATVAREELQNLLSK
jgi:UDP-N-acetylmuramoyl-L-alanyl-D-glutamate--2,6-diaminopimelate ligase